jgi:hypothetical protein
MLDFWQGLDSFYVLGTRSEKKKEREKKIQLEVLTLASSDV